MQPLVNYINKEFQELDFNTGLAFDAVKILSLFRALYEELKRKFIPWSDETVERCWDEISSEHDEVGIFQRIVFFVIYRHHNRSARW